jgi:hypothetical protein
VTVYEDLGSINSLVYEFSWLKSEHYSRESLRQMSWKLLKAFSHTFQIALLINCVWFSCLRSSMYTASSVPNNLITLLSLQVMARTTRNCERRECSVFASDVKCARANIAQKAGRSMCGGHYRCSANASARARPGSLALRQAGGSASGPETAALVQEALCVVKRITASR